MSVDAEPAVTREDDGPVAILTLNNPRRRNALSIPVREALAQELDGVFADESCRAIVLTGAGGHFCAGGDISAMDGLDGISGRKRFALSHRIVRQMIAGEKPIIAAVEGYAAGAGMSVAAACDIVVASADAKFICSFNKIGLMPDLGAAWTLPLRMGLGRAKLAMLRGRELDAVAAERAGLVEIVVEAGSARREAVSLAHELAASSPLSNGFAKALLGRMPRDLDEILRAEADAQGILFTTADFREGRDAFNAKRQPRFSGR